MSKLIMLLVCAFALAACGTMATSGSSGDAATSYSGAPESLGVIQAGP